MTIIEEIRNNPEEGAKRLERECKPGLLALARRLCSDPGDAEELVNRTIAEAVSRIDSLLSQSALFGWMCQILIGCHEKETRRKSNSTVALDPDTAESASDPASDMRIVRDVDASLLRDAIQSLPKEMRDVIVMHFLMDQPVAGVAKFLALPVSTVKWRLHCAKEELARRLGAKASEMARKPLVKTLLLALALCALTALGASLAGVRLLSRPAETQAQQAEDSKGGTTSPLPGVSGDGTPSAATQLSNSQTLQLLTSQGELTMNTTLRTLAASAAFAAATAAIPATAAADDIAVTGSAQTDGLLSSLSLSFPENASPTRLFLAWGTNDCGTAMGNWEHVDWLADVPAGETSCDAPVTTLRSGCPFVRVFRIAPDDSAVELESVTATGTQFVKTGFTPTARTAVRCDFTLDAFANQAIFGCRSAAGANSFCLLTIVPSGSAGHGWRFDYGNQIKNSYVDPVAGQRYLAEADYQGLKINGTLLPNATIGSLYTVQPGCVLALFGMSTAGGVASQAQTTIHSFKAWSDTDSKATTLASDLVPCRKNGVVSFYNRANGTFESLVTGTLTGGADKAHSSCGTTVDTSAAFHPYGTDRTMSVVKFYRERRQPTADLTITAGLADCALVAAHDSVDHGGVIADWPVESTAILAVIPAATTSTTVTIPWRIEDGEEHYFRFFLVARSGSTTYDRQFEGIRATGTQYVLTDFVPTQTANVMVDFKFDTAIGNQVIFGARQGASSASFAVWHLENGLGYRFDYANWNANSSHPEQAVDGAYLPRVINAYSAGLEVAGERILSVPTSAKIDFTAPCPMAVFALNTAGTVNFFAKGVCRYVKAWRVMSQENTRVLDLLPAMKNGEVGFYNKCDGKFFGNSGTGAFEAVNEVVNTTAQILSDSGTLGVPPPGAFLMIIR